MFVCFLNLSHGRAEVQRSILCWLIGMCTVRGSLFSHSLPFWDVFVTAMPLPQPFPTSYGAVHLGWYKASATLPLHMAVTSENRPDKFRYVSIHVFLVTAHIFSCPNLLFQSHDSNPWNSSMDTPACLSERNTLITSYHSARQRHVSASPSEQPRWAASEQTERVTPYSHPSVTAKAKTL